MKVLWTYLCVDQMFSIGMFFLSWLSVNNHSLAHTGTPFYFGLMMWFFAEVQTNQRIRSLIYWVLALYIVAWGVLMLTVENVQGFSTYTVPLSDALLILFSGLSLSTLYRRTSAPFHREPIFWFLCAIFFYHLGAFIFQLSNNLLVSISLEYFLIALGVREVLFILRNLIFTVGFFYMYHRRPPQSAVGVA